MASTVKLRDGRLLGYEDTGPSDSPTVLYFHGFPGSHPEGGMIKSNVRLITIARPGFGESTFQPGRSFADWPNDVLELVDQLGIESFYIIGFSGGAPYAVACLNAIPKRLLRVAIVAGAYPGCLTSLLPHILDFAAGRMARDPDPEKLSRYFMNEVGSRHPKEAQSLEDPHIRKAAIESCRESFRQGGYAMAWEARMLSSDWGLAPVDGSRADVWYGMQDKNLPGETALTALDHWGGATLHRLEDEAHVSLLVNHTDEILAHLLTLP